MGLRDGLRRLDDRVVPPPRATAPRTQVLLGLAGLGVSAVVLVLSLVGDEASVTAFAPLTGFSLAAVICGVRAQRAAARGTLVPPNELFGPLGLGIAFTTYAVLPALAPGNRADRYLVVAAAFFLIGVTGIVVGLRRPYRASR